MPREFDIIDQYFSHDFKKHASVKLGIGDDAAITTIPSGMEQVIAIDTLVAGVHFDIETDAYSIAWKALAVNLSDIAAMGATPAWFTLALTLPEISEPWLAEFSRGLVELANRYKISLIGGDTTRGPMSVTIQVAGFVQQGKALLRSGAKAGDHIFVTGNIGDGCAGLAVQRSGTTDKESQYLLQHLHQPRPRVAVGEAMVGIASACIDISDGVLADLSHILSASQLGASVELNKLPLSDACSAKMHELQLTRLSLAQGGDDYELCFTVPQNNVAMLDCSCNELGIRVTRIGQVEAQPGLRCYQDGVLLQPQQTGYQHF